MGSDNIKDNIVDKNQWLRIVYMILFAFILYFVMFLVFLIVVVQAIFALFTGKRNEDIAGFAINLSTYVHNIVAFLTYSDDMLPFPFSSWGAETGWKDNSTNDESSADTLNEHRDRE